MILCGIHRIQREFKVDYIIKPVRYGREAAVSLQVGERGDVGPNK